MYSKNNDQLGPFNGNISPLPRTSCIAPGQAGIKQQVSRNAKTTPVAGVIDPSHLAQPPKRKVTVPMIAPMIIIGCKRTKRRLKKSPNDILFQRSS